MTNIVFKKQSKGPYIPGKAFDLTKKEEVHTSGAAIF